MLLCASDCVESSGGGAGAGLARQAFVLWRETVRCSVHRPGASWGVRGRSRNRHEDPGIHSHSCSVSLTTSCLSLRWLHGLFSFSSQYPGVAESIHSDINNLMSVLKMSVVLPEGNNYWYIQSLFKQLCFEVRGIRLYMKGSGSCHVSLLEVEERIHYFMQHIIWNDLIHVHQQKWPEKSLCFAAFLIHNWSTWVEPYVYDNLNSAGLAKTP